MPALGGGTKALRAWCQVNYKCKKGPPFPTLTARCHVEPAANIRGRTRGELTDQVWAAGTWFWALPVGESRGHGCSH